MRPLQCTIIWSPLRVIGVSDTVDYQIQGYVQLTSYTVILEIIT